MDAGAIIPKDETVRFPDETVNPSCAVRVPLETVKPVCAVIGPANTVLVGLNETIGVVDPPTSYRIINVLLLHHESI